MVPDLDLVTPIQPRRFLQEALQPPPPTPHPPGRNPSLSGLASPLLQGLKSAEKKHRQEWGRKKKMPSQAVNF